jgi:tetratricopeptide (TPR) repeat protein
LAAQDALAKGDQQTALQELDASLAAQPDAWAYYQRARLLADMGQDQKAISDCAAGLQLDPAHGQLKWLQAELKKPAAARFQGRNKEPPVTK